MLLLDNAMVQTKQAAYRLKCSVRISQLVENRGVRVADTHQ